MCTYTNVGDYSTTWLNIASAGMGIAQSVAQGVQQQQVNKANNRAVAANYNAQLNQFGVQQGQINQQAAQEKGSIALEALKKRGSLIASAGEAGVSGGSVTSAENAVAQGANRAVTNVELNRQGKIAQSNAQAQSARADAISRFRDENFNWLGTGLQIAKTGMDFASTLQKRKA